MRIRERADEKSIGEAEDDGGGTDAESENGDGGEGDDQIFAHEAKRVAKVLDDHVDVLLGRVGENADSGMNPDGENLECGASGAAAIVECEAEFTSVFAAEFFRVEKHQAAIGAEGGCACCGFGGNV